VCTGVNTTPSKNTVYKTKLYIHRTERGTAKRDSFIHNSHTTTKGASSHSPLLLVVGCHALIVLIDARQGHRLTCMNHLPSVGDLKYCPSAFVPPLAPPLIRNRSCTPPLKLRRMEVPLFVRWEDYVPRFLPTIHNVTFVQVGASCGANVRDCAIGGDPIWNYAVACGWNGVAVEAVSSTFKRLCHHYGRFNRQVQPVHAAIAGAGGLGIMARRGETSKLIRGPLANTDHSFRARADRNEELSPALTLHDIWPKPLGAAVLVIDAEGSESSILGRGDLPTPMPKLILFEHAHLTITEQNIIDNNLVRQGFSRLVDLKHMDRSARSMNQEPQDRLYGHTRLRDGQRLRLRSR
jgi:hypothetical protein